MSKFASIVSASPRTMPDLPTAIKKPRGHPEIINIQAIKTEIETSWHNTETPNEFKAALLKILRKSLKTGSQAVKERFLSRNNGAETVLAQAFLMDTLIQITHETIIEKLYRAPNPTQGEQLCIVAVGGYGRGELAPFSDIDLLFLLPYKLTPHTEQVVETILYLLWDMRLKVGHSTRSIQECMHQAKADMTIRTAILESRFIIGEVSLLNQMIKRFQREVVAGTALDFVEAKLKESENRHKKLGDSRYVIEPNIKDGKGGLRDLHKLFWIAKYVYQTNTAEELVTKGILSSREANHFAKAQKQLWTIRCHLHYLAGREEDRLTVDHQHEIATKLGYTDRSGNIAVERFMKHYYLTAKNIGDLTRIFCAAIEAEHQRKPRLRISAAWQKSKNLGDFKLDSTTKVSFILWV